MGNKITNGRIIPNIAVQGTAGLFNVTPDMIQKQVINSAFMTKKAIDNMYRFGDCGKSDIIGELLRSYLQKMIDEKQMLKLSEVKKMNILDTTSFLPPPDNGYGLPGCGQAGPEIKKAIEDLGWYAFIPCFETGAVKLNKFRYFIFEVEEIDPEKEVVTIRLHDYMKPEEGLWQPGVSTTMAVRRVDRNKNLGETSNFKSGSMIMSDKESKYYVEIAHYDDLNFIEMYTMYSPDELGWTKEQHKVWMETVVKNSKDTTDYVYRKYDTDQCDQLAGVFTVIISRCNAMLELNKPSRPVGTKRAGTGSSKCFVAYEDGEAPKRIIRNVGLLRVQSESVPKRPRFETVITYKMAKWTVRGHVRHYKNGKEVYIKPSVKTRKALKDTGQVTASTIRFRKKKNKDNQEV